MTPMLSPAGPSPSGRVLGALGALLAPGAPRAPGAKGCSTAERHVPATEDFSQLIPNENNWHIIFKYYIFFQFIYL